VGYYIVRHRRCPVNLDGDASELKQLYVLSSEYGSGLGKALLAHALAVIRDAGRSWVWLCVADRNLRAQAFYRKHGFRPAGPGPVLAVGSDRLPSTIMVRRLQTAR
jgi:ribosomal protein S18 acetylase RimI-like enzyme